MKKERLLRCAILLAIWLLVPWHTSLAAVYVNEDFDAKADLTGGLPIGWDNSRSTNNRFKWTQYDLGDEGRCMRYQSDYYNDPGNVGVLLTPAFTPSASTYIDFYFKNQTGGDLSVFVTTDDGETFIDTLESLLRAPVWTLRRYQLGDYARMKNVRIAFYSVSNGDNSQTAHHFLDDVLIQDEPLCAQPVNLRVRDLTQTSATLSWELGYAGTDPDKYKLQVIRISDGYRVVDEEITSNDFSFMLDGLTVDTRYAVTLRSDCRLASQGWSDVSETFRFSTLPEPIDLSYVQKFDTDVLPDGLFTIGKVEMSGNTSENKGFSARLVSTVEEQSIIVFPQINHAADDMQFNAYVLGDVGTTFSVGLLSDPTNAATFFPLRDDTLRSGKVWTEVRLNSAEYGEKTIGMSFAVMLPKGAQSSLNIDNVEIIRTPVCPRPELLTASRADSNSVHLRWESKAGVGSHRLRFMTESDTVYRLVDSNPAVVKGLEEDTEYTVQVRDLCSASDSSEWSLPARFGTLCGTMDNTLFHEGFESGMPMCWKQIQTVRGNGLGQNYGDKTMIASTSGPHTGYRCLEVRGAMEGSRTQLILQPVSIDKAKKYDLTFWMRRVETTYRNDGINVWVSSTPDTTNARKLCFIPGDYRSEPVEPNAGWFEYEYNVDLKGVVYFIFEHVSENGLYLFIDDIELKETPTCRKINVSTVKYENTGNTEMTLSWKARASENKWLVDYTLTSDAGTEVDTVTVQGEPKLVFDQLAAATEYQLECRIAAYCGVGDTSVWVQTEKSFATACEPISKFPHVEGFNEPAFPPKCWTRRQIVAGVGSGTDYGDECWERNTDDVWISVGSGSALLNDTRRGTHTLLVTPPMDIPTDKPYQVSFDMYRSIEKKDSLEGVKVWINSTPDTVGGKLLAYMKHAMNQYPAVDKAGMYHYSFPLEDSGVKYVVFDGISRYVSRVVIDEVVIEEIPSCPKMGEFTVDSVSVTTASVILKDTASRPGTWQAEYGVKGYEPGSGTAVSASLRALRFTGLTAATEYDVYVRRVCDGEFSGWSVEPVSFETMCEAFEVTADKEFFDGMETYKLTDTLSSASCFTQVISDADKAMKPFTVSDKYSIWGTTKILPYEGNAYAQSAYGNYSWLFTPVYLRAGVDYEISGWFVSSDAGLNYTSASIGIASLPMASCMMVMVEENVGISNEWKLLSGYFNVPADGIYYAGWNMSQGQSDRSGIDNMRLRQVDCIPPTLVSLVEVNANSATVGWQSSATEWELKVTETDAGGDAASGIVFNDTVQTSSQLIPNLEPETEYYCYLRSICGDKASDWTAVMSFETRCLPVTVPQTEDFDKYNDISEFKCWTVTGDNASIDLSTQKHSGLYALSISDATLSSPELDVESLARYMITGWVQSSVDSARFAVGVDVAPDGSDYLEISSVLVPKRYKWQEFKVFFTMLNEPDLVGFDPKFISLVVSGEDVKLYFDDIAIQDAPTCPQPTNMKFEGTTATSFTLGWEANAQESEWLVEVMKDGILESDTTVKTNPCTIVGLSPNTMYSVNLQALCSTEDASEKVSCGEITTECLDYKLPHRLDLSTAKVGTLPLCWWSVGGTSVLSTDAWRVVEVDGYRAVKYTDWGNSSDYWQRLVTPVFDLGTETDIEVEFEVEVTAESKDLLVFMSTDGGNTFAQAVDTVHPKQGVQLRSHLLKVASGSRVCFAFDAYGGSSPASATSLRSFTVSSLSSCLKPQGIEFVDATSSSMKLRVLDDAEQHTAWQLIYGTVGFDTANAIPVPVAQNKECEITGLVAQTTYQFYVRAVCSETDKSDWRGPVTFSTPCAAMSLPYHEGFEDYTTETMDNACFSIVTSRASGAKYPSAEISEGAYNSEDSKGLKFVSSASEDIYLVLPKMADPLNTLVLQFDYRNESDWYANPQFTVGVMSSPDDITTFVPVQTCNIVGSFTTKKINFSEIATALNGDYIAFQLGHYQNGNYAGIDAIYVRSIDACPDIENIDVMAVGSDSVKLKANAMRVVPQYQVAYGTVGSTVDKCENKMIVDANEFTIKDLAEATAYSVYVRAICAKDDTAQWSRPVSFTTNCKEKVLAKGDKWTENFDSYEHLSTPWPPCFTKVQADPSLLTSNAVSPTRCLFLSGNGAVALPAFDIDADRLKISFTAYGNGYLYVGLADKLDMNSVKELKCLSIYYERKECEVDLSEIGFTGKYVILYMKGMSWEKMYIDDLNVEWAPTCYAPRNVLVREVTEASVTVGYTSSPDATEHQYRLVTGTDTVIEAATTNPLVIENLDPSTDYSVSMRSSCGDAAEGYTDWSTAATFRTMIVPATVPYDGSFENDDENSRWTVLYSQYGMGDKFIIGSDADGVKSGTKALYISNNGADYQYSGPYYYSYNGTYDTEIIYAYRTMRLNAGTYQCSYDWIGSGSVDNNGRVFVMPESETLVENMDVAFADIKPYVSTIGDKLYGATEWTAANGSFDIEKAGLYRLVVGWIQKNDPTGNTPLAVDNIKIVKDQCSKLYSVETKNVQSTSADVYYVNPNDDVQVEYTLSAEGGEPRTEVVSESPVHLTELTPATNYTLTIRPMCAALGSDRVVTVVFSTKCTPEIITSTEHYFEGFEDYDTDKSELDLCWQQYATSGSAAWVVRNTADIDARRPYEGHGYATLQYSNQRTMVRDFMLEAGKSYEIAAWAKQDKMAGATASIVLRKGDADEVLIQMPVDSSWTELVGELQVTETGVYSLGVNASLNYEPAHLCLDNFEVTQLLVDRPTDLKLDSTGSDYAGLSWNGDAAEYQVQLIKDELVERTETVQNKRSIVLGQLSPSTRYKVSVRAMNDGQYSRWQSLTFVTDCAAYGLPFSQNFDSETVKSLPPCWDGESASSDISHADTWTVYALNDGEKVMRLGMGGASGHNVMLSPAITLPAERAYALSFDYNVSADDKLYVAVSANGGKSFDKALLVSGRTESLESAIFRLNGYKGQTIHVALICDVSENRYSDYIYVDNVSIDCIDDDVVYDIEPICLGDGYINHGFDVATRDLAVPGDYTFERFVPAATSDDCGHFEVVNVRVSEGGSETVNDTICEGLQYPISDIFPYPITEQGTYIGYKNAESGCATEIVLNLVVENPRSEQQVTICEDNLPYIFNGIECDTTGVYIDTITTGTVCDSISILRLTVLPKYIEHSHTVCEGEIYQWGDMQLKESGRYERKFKYNNEFGCDSIEVMHFTVLPAKVSIDTTICYGQSVQLGTELYSTTGVYSATFENEQKCKYTVELDLKVLAPDTISMTDISCEDKPYFGHGFQDLTISRDTVLLRSEKDNDGCVSVTRVDVDFIETVEVFDTVGITPGGSYNFCGNSYNEEGTFTCVTQSDVTRCDSITHLTIRFTTGLDLAASLPITLAPNPVKMGDLTTIHRTWTLDEQKGLTVETINSFGQVLSSERPMYYPIVIRAPHASGVYYIRIVAGTGEVYIARLIVK